MGIAVGLVISGEYFGWSYGWAQAGTLGFLLSSVFVAIIYRLHLQLTELTTAIPHAGGPFAYARRAFGPIGGLSPVLPPCANSYLPRRPSRWPSVPI
jgi:ethanolamine permease